MATEYKKQQKSYNFFILGDINECKYTELKKEVFERLKEIEDNDRNNIEYLKSLDYKVEIKEETPIDFNFHISTYGGSIYDGLGIYDLIHKLDRINKRVNVNMFCEGKIMSAGIFIMLAAQHRYCTPNTTFMIHQLSSCALGKLEDLKEDVKEGERLDALVNNIITSNTSITKEEIEEWFSHRQDVFFDAHEAIEKGLIDKII